MVPHRVHVVGRIENAELRAGRLSILGDGAAGHQQAACNQNVKEHLAVAAIVQLVARIVQVLGDGV